MCFRLRNYCKMTVEDLAMFERFNYRKVTAAEIKSGAEALIDQQKALYDRISAVPLAQVTYDTVIKVINFTVGSCE